MITDKHMILKYIFCYDKIDLILKTEFFIIVHFNNSGTTSLLPQAQLCPM